MSDILKQWLDLCKSGSVQEIKDYGRKHGDEIIKEIVRLKNAGMNSIDEIERLHAAGGDK